MGAELKMLFYLSEKTVVLQKNQTKKKNSVALSVRKKQYLVSQISALC